MTVVAELMVKNIVAASPDESVSSAVHRMAEMRVGSVLLVDGTGKLTGLFTERDLLSRVIGAGKEPATTALRDVATRNVVTVSPDAPIKKVLQLFRENKFRHLPVVHEGKAVGILSTRDFLEVVVLGLEKFIDEIKYKHALDQGLDPYDHIGGSYGR